MRDEVSIQPANPDCAEAISELALQSKGYWGYPDEFLAQCKSELTVTREDIENPNVQYVVALLDRLIVGFYALEQISPQDFELDALYVKPEFIGKSIGRRLIQHALDWVKVSEGKNLLIQGDPNAEKFYLAMGGVKCGQRESGSIPGRYLPLFSIAVKS